MECCRLILARSRTWKPATLDNKEIPTSPSALPPTQCPFRAFVTDRTQFTCSQSGITIFYILFRYGSQSVHRWEQDFRSSIKPGRWHGCQTSVSGTSPPVAVLGYNSKIR